MSSRNRTYTYLAAVALVVCSARAVFAFPGFDESVVTKYPTATNLESCGTCHNDFSPGPTALNPYGQAINQVISGFDIDQALSDVESLDSDGDGTTNIDEIETDAGFFPGWTCETYTNAVDPPSDLADLVDPIDPSCDGVTTTSTVTSTSTSVTVTSTTLPGDEQCSQPLSSGPTPVATDCLYILNAAVQLVTCSPECICAPTGTLPPKATDALVCLNASVGIPVPLNCPCNGGTSTTVTSTTGTSTSTSTEDSSTTTSTSTTTTTT